ncbi:nucleotide exchange factor GrpE [Chachezhania sediminis]|uniref:hypothetical protein n=1 Tax=Chachezhania sediminis TaxID=2599291 RepID=UPI00131CBAA2|nr:hypothetical protein [Chachezhania sediminis]
MSQIEDLQGRLTAALARIGKEIDALEADTDEGPLKALETALEDEKLANAQLEERLTGLKTRHAEEIEALKAELDRTAELDQLKAQLSAQSDAMVRLDMEMQRLRAAGEQLLATSEGMRTAETGSDAMAAKINRAMLAELEALRALRAGDMAEAGAVLAKLEPLLAAAEVN